MRMTRSSFMSGDCTTPIVIPSVVEEPGRGWAPRIWHVRSRRHPPGSLDYARDDGSAMTPAPLVMMGSRFLLRRRRGGGGGRRCFGDLADFLRHRIDVPLLRRDVVLQRRE